jgi:hypothetical protein
MAMKSPMIEMDWPPDPWSEYLPRRIPPEQSSTGRPLGRVIPMSRKVCWHWIPSWPISDSGPQENS